MLKKIILSFFIISFCAGAATASDYTIDDLRALKAQGGWEELLGSAKAIKPSQRDAEWQALVTEAATKYLAVKKPDDYSGYTSATLIAEYPFLAQNTTYASSAGETTFNDFKSCIENTDGHWGYTSCVEEFKQNAGSTGFVPESAIKAAKFMKGKLTDYELAPFYEMALKAGGTSHCNDADLQQAALDGFINPSYGPAATSARNIAFNYCKNELAGAVEARKAKETAQYTQRTRFFMQNYCVFKAETPECVKADF